MIYYINLDSATDRRADFEAAFTGAEITRVPGVDGLGFSNGELRVDGRPEWDPESRADAENPGILLESSGMSPTEYGCAMAHFSALLTALNAGESHIVICEDDVEPVEGVDPSGIYSSACGILDKTGAGFLTLIGSAHPDKRTRIYPSWEIRSIRSLAGYAMPRWAVERVLNDPELAYPMDFHLSLLYFSSMGRPAVMRQLAPHYSIDRLPERFPALGLGGAGFLRLSSGSVRTCMTPTGDKPWETE